MKKVVIVGAGYTGLAAAYHLTASGYAVTLVEADESVGGLAGAFQVEGASLEKFYHHLFTNDHAIMELIEKLDCSDQVLYRPTATGMYYNKSILQLSTPLDLLRYKPLSFVDRIRLGLLAVRSRFVSDWRVLDRLSAEEWLRHMVGDAVFEKIWQPLLVGKFGKYASEVSAAWIWSKLKLRGGSRTKQGGEMLAYYRGGFAALANEMLSKIRSQGGELVLGQRVTDLMSENGSVRGVKTDQGLEIEADIVIATTPIPNFIEYSSEHLPRDYINSISKINYLANVCLILVLDRSLSGTYWLNVSDPNFPYVGVIEHTNFEPPESYGGKNIVYMSKYLTRDADLYHMDDKEVYEHSVPHIQRMFPDFSTDWVSDYHVWRAPYSQAVVCKNYADLVPSYKAPLSNLYLSTMAQIYPEDRGTNHAVREGKKVAQLIIASE